MDELKKLPGYRTIDVLTSGIVDPSSHKSETGHDAKIGGARSQYMIDHCIIVEACPLVSLKASTYIYRDPTDLVFTHDELASMPVSNLRDVLSVVPGVYQARRGDDISIFGARSGGTQYIIDGIRQ